MHHEDDFSSAPWNDFSIVQPGKPAPEFHMEGFLKGDVRHYTLEEFRGKWVVLFFYPLDFTFVCPTELVELNRQSGEFKKLNTQVLGVSVDSVHAHAAWLKEMGDFDFPLLSDLNHRAGRDYNVLVEEKGLTLRGTFVIDPEGILRSYTVNDLPVGRSIDELLRLVTAFQTGELCPVGWKKGHKTLGKA